MSGAIAVLAVTGLRYRLAWDGIVDYWQADRPGYLFVQMSKGAAPVLVAAALRDMDAVYARIGTCPILP